MKQSAVSQLKKIIGVFAIITSLLVSVLLPSGYFYVQYSHLSSNLQFKADILAHEISTYAFQYPESWFFQEDRLAGFLEKNIQLDRERVVLQSQKSGIHIYSGEHGGLPLMQRFSQVHDGSDNVAEVEIQSSLYVIIIKTIYVFIASLMLGLLIFGTLYFWPFKVLKLAIIKLDDVRLKLESEVAENKSLLTQSEGLTQELTSQCDFNDTVLEVAGNVIVLIDMNDCFYRFNRAAEELTGFKREEVLGNSIWDLLIPEDQKEKVRSAFDDLSKGNTERAGHCECDWLTREGTRRTLDWHNSVLYNQAGEITHFVCLGYDVTERKAVEKSQQRLQRELNQARKMEALGQLTGGIAHDFNNILGIIRGYSDLAIDELDESSQADIKEYMANILQSTKRASDLVKQMMVFGRAGQSRQEPHDMQQVISECIKMLRSMLPSSISIEFYAESHLPDVVMDTIQIHQIMINLCLNAKDAMQGVGKLEIKLGWHRNIDMECRACHKQVTGDWLELSVSDSGCGINEKDIDRIFEPFFTTKGVGEGTGMGLSMIHTIIENHSAHILIDTELNKGTTFKLLFPSMPLQQGKLALVKEPAPEQKDYQGQGEKILIVDDEPAIVSFINNLFTKKGYQCEAKTCSLEALAQFKSDPDAYDLLMTDQTMPEMSGVDLIKEVRRIKPQLPVILATGYSESINREQAEKSGIVYITKPFNRNDLLKSVADSLRDIKPDG